MKKTIVSGRLFNGVYQLDICPLVHVACHSLIDVFRWHCRLGHPHVSLLCVMCLSPIIVSKLECEAYELGKYYNPSYPPRINKHNLRPFSLMHYDIWDPCRVPNIKEYSIF